jgi:hypothetical protein
MLDEVEVERALLRTLLEFAYFDCHLLKKEGLQDGCHNDLINPSNHWGVNLQSRSLLMLLKLFV